MSPGVRISARYGQRQSLRFQTGLVKGKAFQEKVFQGMLSDPQWAAQMIEVMTHEYFELKYLQYLCDRFFGFYLKNKNFPNYIF